MPQQLRLEDLPDTASRYIPQERQLDNLVDLASDDDDHATATVRGSRLGVTDDNSIFSLDNIPTHGSIKTTITSPESDPKDFIDAGMGNDDEIDHIVNATTYYDNLQLLRLRTAQICGIDNGPSSRDPSHDDWQLSYKKILEGLCHLQSEGFCGQSMSIIVEDRNRPGVAVTVPIWLYDIKFLCATPLWRLEFYELWNHDSSDFILRTSSLQKLLGRLLGKSVDLPQRLSLEYISYDQFVTKALSAGLLSFSGSHACQFDLEIWQEPVEEVARALAIPFALAD